MQVEEIHSKESMDLRNSEKGRSLEMCYTVFSTVLCFLSISVVLVIEGKRLRNCVVAVKV